MFTTTKINTKIIDNKIKVYARATVVGPITEYKGFTRTETAPVSDTLFLLDNGDILITDNDNYIIQS